jgi:four helix bundle protein
MSNRKGPTIVRWRATQGFKPIILQSSSGIPNVHILDNTLRSSELRAMKFDLEERVLRFGISVLDVTERMHDTKASNHLRGQLIRSATATPLMYGEVNAAESPADFIHKMGMGLKELRETKNCLRMIQMKKYVDDLDQLEKVLDENQQLILIFGASINTAKKKLNNRDSA